MKRILIDGGSSTDILFLDAFEKMGRSKRDLKRVDFPLIGFPGRTTYPLGAITRPVILGEGWKSIEVSVAFIVVDAPALYNAILGRTTINPNKIVASIVHQKMKFPTPNGIGKVLGD